MRDYILLFINGREHRVRGAEAFLTLSDYLRGPAGLVGTKIVCSEGDCGACSVLVGRPDGARLRYAAVDSCIQFLYQLDGAHVVTVDGLKKDGALSAVQDAMVKCFGSQCGFCTPGFVVAMTGMMENRSCAEAMTEDELREGLSGNLCRCTGYVQILEAGKAIDPAASEKMAARYPEGPMLAAMRTAAAEDVRVADGDRTVFAPTDLKRAAQFRAEHAGCIVVAGATDIGVQHNKGRIEPKAILSLGRIAGLGEARIADGVLDAGARTPWSRIEALVREAVPEYHQVLLRFGAPQIRNAGTIGGNFANASPIADSLPFHFVCETELELVSPSGKRTVAMGDFYLGYKKLALRPDELIARIRTRLPQAGESLKLYKVSRRKDLDISTFTAAILMKRSAGRIVWARIAYGGVGPVILRLPKTESFLEGRPFDEETMRTAGRLARTEIAPLGDVRGSKDFRLQLAENVMVKYWHECGEPVATISD